MKQYISCENDYFCPKNKPHPSIPKRSEAWSSRRFALQARILLLGDGDVDEVGMSHSLLLLRIVPSDRFKPYCNNFSRFLASDRFRS